MMNGGKIKLDNSSRHSVNESMAIRTLISSQTHGPLKRNEAVGQPDDRTQLVTFSLTAPEFGW